MEVIKILGGALLGAFAVLLSQLISNYYANKRHQSEMMLKRNELAFQFLVPVSKRRIEALEHLYDLIQKFIEDEKLSLEVYTEFRKTFIYLKKSIREELIEVLELYLKEKNYKNETNKKECISRLKKVQNEIRELMGLPLIYKTIEQINKYENE